MPPHTPPTHLSSRLRVSFFIFRSFRGGVWSGFESGFVSRNGMGAVGRPRLPHGGGDAEHSEEDQHPRGGEAELSRSQEVLLPDGPVADGGEEEEPEHEAFPAKCVPGHLRITSMSPIRWWMSSVRATPGVAAG